MKYLIKKVKIYIIINYALFSKLTQEMNFNLRKSKDKMKKRLKKSYFLNF